MRLTHRTSHRDATASPARELTIPRGRRPVPTQTRLHTRRVPVAMYVIALLVIPSLVVFGFMAAGLWATTGTSVTAQASTPSEDGGTGVKGHEDLPRGGHETCPVTVTSSAR